MVDVFVFWILIMWPSIGGNRGRYLIFKLRIAQLSPVANMVKTAVTFGNNCADSSYD
jgi:hypothetical protein